MTKKRIAIKDMNAKGKVGAAFPQFVKDAVNDLAMGSVKSFRFITVAAGEMKFVTCEGHKYIRLGVNGERVALEVASGDTLGGAGLFKELFREFPMNEGEWLVEYYWHYGMTVYHILPPALVGEKKDGDKVDAIEATV